MDDKKCKVPGSEAAIEDYESEINKSEVNESEGTEIEVNETETEVNETEVTEREINENEAKESRANENEVNESESEENETEVNEREINENEEKESRANENEVNESEVNEGTFPEDSTSSSDADDFSTTSVSSSTGTIDNTVTETEKVKPAEASSQNEEDQAKLTDNEQDEIRDSFPDITADLSSSEQLRVKSTAPPEDVAVRLRAESSISCSSDEYSERPLSWASSGSDQLSYQSSGKFSVWSGSSVRSSSSYAPSISDYSDQELEPEPNTHKPHRGRTTIRRKDEPKDIQEKRKKKAFNIVNEIRTTEETFVKVLRLLNESYRNAILRAGNALGRPVVPLDVMGNILKYLPELQDLNEDLLKDFKIRIKEWDSNPAIADVFIKKGPFLKLYISYISNFESLTSALDEARKKYPDFEVLTKAFEMSPKCQNLALKHYMLKPVQRLPQYKLLLQDYLKQLMEDSEEYTRTKEALAIVSEVADNANENMKFSDNVKKLWEIQHTLIGPFEVIKPGRRLIKAGMLKKLSRKVMQQRMFFLFSDVLLYTTPVATGYKLNNVFPLISLKVSRSNNEEFQNEFSIMSTQRSFMISAYTPEERDVWLSTIQQTVEDDIAKRQSFEVTKTSPRKKTNSVYREDSTKSPTFRLGTQAPVWIPDDRVTMCMLCTEEFTITFRRHHCRACGKIVCTYCSDNKAPLQYLTFKPARVCAGCFSYLLNEAKSRESSVLEDFQEGTESLSPAAVLARFKGFNWASFRTLKANRPAVLHEVKANDEDAAMSGYLKIWKGYKWKKRWFVLKDNALYTFKASEDAAAIESVALPGLKLNTFKSLKELPHVGGDGLDPGLVIELVHKGTNPMTFRAESPLSKDKWITALQKATKP